MPFGFEGIMSGAALVSFAVFGYDTLTTSAEESKNPQRDLPRAVVICINDCFMSLYWYVIGYD